jgi:hypothetical protein
MEILDREGDPPEAGRAGVDLPVVDRLQDHLAEAEEALAQRPVIGLDLADAPALDAELLERPGRAIEIRREYDEVIDLRDAVGMVGLRRLRLGGRGRRQSVYLPDISGAQPPAEDALARGEVEVDGADPGRAVLDREPGAVPSGGIGADPELFDFDRGLRLRAGKYR